VQAMKAGAIDFLEKPVEDGPLLDAVIRAVARGRAWREARAMREEATSRLASLTPREREVFSLVALGKPNKRIAAELGTTENTIKAHGGGVRAKLGAEWVVDLARLAQKIDQLAGGRAGAEAPTPRSSSVPPMGRMARASAGNFRRSHSARSRRGGS